MKRIILLALFFVAGTIVIWSQVPQAMNYKAVAKDDWGVALPNKTITLRFTILQGSETGAIVYQETHTTATNKFGLMDVEIGKGTPEIGSFNLIDWSTGIYYIQIEMDPNGGTNFRLEDPAYQLLSVPYAMYAGSSGSANFTESDPFFVTSPSSGIWSTDISNWNTAFSWGNHANEGYLKSFTESDPIFLLHPAHEITSDNIKNWNTAYGWGEHAGLYRSIDYVPAWNEIAGKPVFAPVALSGSYNDLTDTPIGTNPGDMQYWNGTSWVIIPAGTAGQVLTFNASGHPSWQNTTSGVGFAVSVSDATDVLTNSATLNGTVNTNGFSATVEFEYGTTTSYGTTVAATQSPLISTSTTNVNVSIAELSANTLYHFRLKVSCGSVVTYSYDMTFNTPGSIPLITLAETTFTTTSTILNAVVNANGLDTDVFFEFGETTDYGTIIAATPEKVQGNLNVNISATITGLTLGKKYHYRLKASNSMGETYSNDKITVYLHYGAIYGGGLIFYLRELTGYDDFICHVCTANDQSAGAIWGCSGTNIEVSFDGSTETNQIVALCSTAGIAARICYDLELNSYNDWFLPSIEELAYMFRNLKANNIGDFPEPYYWSSTQYNSTNAFAGNFSGPEMRAIVQPKDNLFPVRAVRSFYIFNDW